MNSYYLTRHSKNFFIGFSLLEIVIGIGLFLYIVRVPFLQVYALGLGLFSVYASLKKIHDTHLIVTERGIEYHSPWLIMEVKWETIEKISTNWLSGLRVESLFIDNSQIRIKKWTFPDRGPSTPLEKFPHKTIIPISCFADNWRDTELGQQIKQYAPHLFEKEKSMQSA